MTTRTPLEALNAAVEAAGSQASLASALGISPTAVWKWVQSSKRVGGDYALKVAELYGLSPSELRPDLYPHDLGERFYGVAFVNDEPELPLADDVDRVFEIDRRAVNHTDRFQGVDRRARRALA